MTQTLSGPPPPGSPPPGPDWTAQTADRIESVVETVRDKTTVPVTKAARAVVYGLVAGALVSLALVLLVIGLFRLHVYLPFLGGPSRRSEGVHHLPRRRCNISRARGVASGGRRAPRTKG